MDINEEKNGIAIEKLKNIDIKIDQITRSLARDYYKNTLKKLAEQNINNANTLCNFILTEQNEINIKNTTKETKIKILIWISNYLNGKNYEDMTKEDILAFLNNLRKSSDIDPTHKWIGTYNGRYIVLSKFFRWLHNQEEPDNRKRLTPACMQGIKRLTRREKTPYESDDLWKERDHYVFLKYCPDKRDRCYHAMAMDLSARPHEILNLKIKDIKFHRTTDNIQYAEVRIRDGKTGPRSIPLIDGIPYFKEWLAEHPMSTNPEAWVFISTSNNTNAKSLSYDGISYKYEYYKKKFFPSLLMDQDIQEADKTVIRNLLTKPWNLYIQRHSALTDKSQILTEANLRDHAGWSMSSKMTEIYLHLKGESSKALLQRKGLLQESREDRKYQINSINCANCFEPNKIQNKFCSGCGMILSYESYNEIRNEDKQEITNLKNEMQHMRIEFTKIMKIIQQNPLFAHVKPEVLEAL